MVLFAVVSCFSMGYEIPPPWYANLWPEALALGLAFLGLSAYGLFRMRRELSRALEPVLRPLRALYRKWYEWEFGWEKELNNKP